MFRRRRKLAVPGLNTTSTADISFILLVFFLVISSMDSNKGISKQLAPSDKDKQEKITELDSRNVLDVSIGAQGVVCVDGKAMDKAKMAGRILQFVENCPDRKTHVINVTMLADSRYDDYFHVQDAISTAYATVRRKYAMKRYHKTYEALGDDERETVEKACPQRVMESVEGSAGVAGTGGKEGKEEPEDD